jgi:hypothetical protein
VATLGSASLEPLLHNTYCQLSNIGAIVLATAAYANNW